MSRCLICFWEGYLGVAPTVVNVARRFAELGTQVDILTFEGGEKYPPPPSFTENVRVIQLEKFSRRKSWVKSDRFVSRVGRFVDLVTIAKSALIQARKTRYRFVIGIDTIGIIIGYLAVVASNAVRPIFVYWSLEIVFRRELAGWFMRTAKLLERGLSRRVDLIVIQDQQRAELLRQENKIDGIRTAFVPNGAMGRSGLKRRHYLHDLLNLDKCTRVVLYAGVIHELAMSLELAASTKEWPSSYLLVLHERMKRNKDEPYLKAIQEAAGARIRLSLDPVSLDDVDNVFASAFIGIVLYSAELGNNVSSVAFASGKLSYFLRNGIPVIVNSLPGLRSVVETARCGLVVDDLSEIAAAINEIEKDYSYYSRNALTCFDTWFDFRRKFDEAFSDWLVGGVKMEISNATLPFP